MTDLLHARSREKSLSLRKLANWIAVMSSMVAMNVVLPATANAQGSVTLSGTVTLNRQLAPADVDLLVRGAGTECGMARTLDGGRYQVALRPPCIRGTSVKFFLPPTGKEAVGGVLLLASVQESDVSFEGLSAEELVTIGAGALTSFGQDNPAEDLLETQSEIEKQQTKPLIESVFPLLALIISLCFALLGLMVLKHKPASSEADEFSGYRRQVEATVLVLALVALVVLGLGEKIESEGLVSVLAAIVGYTAARATQPSRRSSRSDGDYEGEPSPKPSVGGSERRTNRRRKRGGGR